VDAKKRKDYYRLESEEIDSEFGKKKKRRLLGPVCVLYCDGKRDLLGDPIFIHEEKGIHPSGFQMLESTEHIVPLCITLKSEKIEK